MDKQHLDYFKGLLLKELSNRKHILGLMKDNGTAEADEHYPTELSNYDNHPADTGSELYQLELNHGLKNHEIKLLRDVEAALKRIDDGTYGICSECGAEIGYERLEVKPSAKLCIECEDEKSRLNKERRVYDRPVEEEVIRNPYGNRYPYGQVQYGFDGVELVTDLMKYGSADTPQDMLGVHDYKGYYTNEVDKQGVVDPMDEISNQTYKKQLPD